VREPYTFDVTCRTCNPPAENVPAVPAIDISAGLVARRDAAIERMLAAAEEVREVEMSLAALEGA
jgi:hypothetical protein